MPRGLKGEKRPADVISAAVMIGRIATGEIEDTPKADDVKNAAVVALGRMGGKARDLVFVRYPPRGGYSRKEALGRFCICAGVLSS